MFSLLNTVNNNETVQCIDSNNIAVTSVPLLRESLWSLLAVIDLLPYMSTSTGNNLINVIYTATNVTDILTDVAFDTAESIVAHNINLITSNTGGTQIDSNQVALVISNMLDSSNRCDRFERATVLIQNLFTAGSTGTIVGIPTNKFVTPQFSSSVTRIYDDREFNDFTSATNINIPASILHNSINNTSTATSMDIRIVEYTGSWSHCRSITVTRNTAGIISGLVTIDLTYINGTRADTSALNNAVTFNIPLTVAAATVLMDVAAPVCDITSNSITGTSATIYECNYWDTVNLQWSTNGCTATTVYNNVTNSTSIQCSCTHLAEFAVTYKQISTSGTCVKLCYFTKI
jgi:hypothetical protein